MQHRPVSILLLALAFLTFAHGAAAKTWTVQVGGTTTSSGGYYGGGTTTPVLAFSPAQITINQGDSITFENMGGASHNVHADDNSFRCAAGCDGDGMGGNGNPSSQNWEATVTFTKAGTVPYHCDNHQSMGMTGNIVVNATAPPPITLGGYMSGNWYGGAAQSGQGFELEFTAQSNTAVAYWYVYTPDGTGQTWIYAQATYDTTSNTITMPATLLSGAKFPPNFNPNDLPKPAPDWGSLTFTFTDCNTGTVSWTSSFVSPQGTYSSGTFPIQRLSSVAGTTCP